MESKISSAKTLYSAVIPVYNSATIIEKTVQACSDFFASMDLDYEILLINDGSTDNSWETLEKISKQNKRVKSFNLLKNYGQHSAVYVGLLNVKGDYTITLDDDLQNPPDQIKHLIDKSREGHDLVFGKFYEKKHSFVRKIGSKIINYLNYKIFDKPKGLTLTNFRIIRRDVIDRLKSFKTNFPYIPGLLLIHSNNPANIMVEHKSREFGKSNYTLWRILKLVSVLLINYSSYPLRLVSYIGLSISIVSFLYGIISIVRHIIIGTEVAGWTTIVVLLSFFNGIVLVILGLMGEYLSRILNQISDSQTIHIKDHLNISDV